ncbi:MAG: arginine repressor [Oscillospiraceae bacterium]|nr:arginine repressor [Oscillospiraceae bacterium]
MKSRRQAKLLELINNGVVETQEELTALLNGEGFEVTQATVSRDIKELNITKTPVRSGGYRYTAGGAGAGPKSDKLIKIFKESVTQIDSALNIVVVKTLPGLASGACSALDATEGLGIVGTLAGDDTAFLVMRSNEAAAEFCERIHVMLR